MHQILEWEEKKPVELLAYHLRLKWKTIKPNQNCPFTILSPWWDLLLKGSEVTSLLGWQPHPDPSLLSLFVWQVSRMSMWWYLWDLASWWHFWSATASGEWVSTSWSQPLASSGPCWCKAGSTLWTTPMARSKLGLKSSVSFIFIITKPDFNYYQSFY